MKQIVVDFSKYMLSDPSICNQINTYLERHPNYLINQITSLRNDGKSVLVVFNVNDKYE